MKKHITLIFTVITFSLFAQGTNDLYLKTNYTLAPHNILQGVGYSVGYHWHNNNPISYKIEMGMASTLREREMSETIGDIRLMNLYYNLAQRNVAFIPTWNFLSTNRWSLSTGIGLSCAYQSKIYTLSHYEYKRHPDFDWWTKVMNVDASRSLHVGLLGDFNINYQLTNKWQMSLSTQYQIYYQGEQLLSTGIGIAYQF